MTTTARISGPVGRAAMNHPKDVFTVQQLLNGHMQRDPCRKLLREDGRWSRALERSIATFQQLSGSPVMTQGRIAPATRMFELLAQPPAIFGYERRMAQFMGPEPVIQGSTIEVFIFDGRFISSGSQWGHAAIDIDGKIYSRAPTKYAVLDREEYIYENIHRVKRDIIGLVIRLSNEEKSIIKKELDKRVKENKPYSITANSCSTNVAEILEMIGILSHDPRFKNNPSSGHLTSPKELLLAVSKSGRVIRKVNYSKAN